jgi:hypothetical protein
MRSLGEGGSLVFMPDPASCPVPPPSSYKSFQRMTLKRDKSTPHSILFQVPIGLRCQSRWTSFGKCCSDRTGSPGLRKSRVTSHGVRPSCSPDTSDPVQVVPSHSRLGDSPRKVSGPENGRSKWDKSNVSGHGPWLQPSAHPGRSHPQRGEPDNPGPITAAISILSNSPKFPNISYGIAASNGEPEHLIPLGTPIPPHDARARF